tara:strand:+ start:11405 stop:12160 length:756 start_codon:yes stop_codon:yes gene_type:complete
MTLKKSDKLTDKSLIQNNFYNSKFGNKNITQKNTSENIDLNKRNFIKKSVLGLAGVGGIVAFSKFVSPWVIFRDGTAQNTAASTANFEFVSTTAVTAVSNIDITGLASGYDYIFSLQAIAHGTDSTQLYMRFSDDGGSTFEADANDYMYHNEQVSSTGETFISPTGTNIGNDAGNHIDIEITLRNPGGTGEGASVVFNGAYMSNAATPAYGYVNGAGKIIAATAVDAVQFLPSSGNFKAQGDIAIFRRKLS